MKRLALSLLAATLLCAPQVHAHATFAETEVKQGAAARFTLRIPHGCGPEATLRLRIRIPEGVVAVKPMPKADWQLETKSGTYETPQKLGENRISEGVVELIWTGNLPDAYYDEFVFRATVADSIEVGTRVYVPAVQECASGSERWIEIPENGGDGHHLDRPAPSFKVIPSGAHHH